MEETWIENTVFNNFLSCKNYEDPLYVLLILKSLKYNKLNCSNFLIFLLNYANQNHSTYIYFGFALRYCSFQNEQSSSRNNLIDDLLIYKKDRKYNPEMAEYISILLDDPILFQREVYSRNELFEETFENLLKYHCVKIISSIGLPSNYNMAMLSVKYRNSTGIDILQEFIDFNKLSTEYILQLDTVYKANELQFNPEPIHSEIHAPRSINKQIYTAKLNTLVRKENISKFLSLKKDKLQKIFDSLIVDNNILLPAEKMHMIFIDNVYFIYVSNDADCEIINNLNALLD